MIKPELKQRLAECLADWQQWGLSIKEPAIDDCIQISAGNTNTSFILTTDASRLLIRLEASNSDVLGLDRETEYKVHSIASQAGLTPAILFRNKAKGYWVREYFEGQTLPVKNLSRDQLKQVTDVLLHLHSLPVPDDIPTLIPAEKAGHYWDQLSLSPENESLLPLRETLQNKLGSSLGGTRCLCHMDTVPANWLQAERMYLMDWEYASAGHPCWDIASFLEQLEINQGDEAYFLKSYFQGADLAIALPKARLQLSYLSTLWFRLQGLISVEKTEKELQILLNSASNA